MISEELIMRLKNSKIRLGREGLVIYEPSTPITIRLNHQETNQFLDREIDFAKLDEPCEIVHLEISNQCNLDCPYCYVVDKHGMELSTEQWKKIIEDLVSYGIFQVTFGGGEPTLRKDLGELALYVRESGLNLCMTTNGTLVSTLSQETMQLFNQINISYHQDFDLLQCSLEYLADSGISRGLNFLMLDRYMDIFPQIKRLCQDLDVELLILAGKGIDDALDPASVMREAKQAYKEGVKAAVDGLACSDEIPDYCMQKRRFCDVDSLGNVFPCSFVRDPMGNLLEKSFEEIWRSRGNQVLCPFKEK